MPPHKTIALLGVFATTAFLEKWYCSRMFVHHFSILILNTIHRHREFKINLTADKKLIKLGQTVDEVTCYHCNLLKKNKFNCSVR